MHNKLTSGDTESGKQWDPFSDNKLQQLISERERREEVTELYHKVIEIEPINFICLQQWMYLFDCDQ